SFNCCKLLQNCCTDWSIPTITVPDSYSEFGSGTGTRTLNLAVNRSAQPVQKSRFVFAGCRQIPSGATVCRRRCCTSLRRHRSTHRKRQGRIGLKAVPKGACQLPITPLAVGISAAVN